MEKLVEKLVSPQPWNPRSGEAHDAPWGASCGEAVRAEPPGGQSPGESGGIQTAPSRLACWRRENERNYTKLPFCKPPRAERGRRVIASPPSLPPKAEGAPAIIQNARFVSLERTRGSAAWKAVNCSECADLGAGAASRAKRDIGAVRGASAAQCAAPRRSARLSWEREARPRASVASSKSAPQSAFSRARNGRSDRPSRCKRFKFSLTRYIGQYIINYGNPRNFVTSPSFGCKTLRTC